MRAWRLFLPLALTLGALAPTAAVAQRDRSAADDEARQEAFEPYEEALDRGDKAGAADALAAIVEDEDLADYRGEAWAALGGLLRELDLPYSALLAYSLALADDPDGGDAAITPALDLSDQVGDTGPLEAVFAGNIGLAAGSAERSRVAWLGARHAYRSGELSVALAALSMVEDSSPVFLRAQLLRGLILSQQGRYTDALPPLLTADGLAAGAGDAELTTLTSLSAARAYYALGVQTLDREGLAAAAGSFARASEYYARVPRSSPSWPQAQLERAWTHYRLEDLSGALGYLQSFTTPFFEDWYVPEAKMLRVYALFLLCKFPEASAQIADFKRQYEPVRSEVAPTLAAMDARAVYEDALRFAEGGETRLPAMFLRDYPDEARFTATAAAVRAAEEELDRLDSAGSRPFTDLLTERVTARREALILEEGARIAARVEAQVSAVDGWLQDTDILKLDMLKYETRLFEQAAATGGFEDPRALARRKLRRGPGELAWAYEGELWADELGWYRVEAKPECPASMQAGASN